MKKINQKKSEKNAPDILVRPARSQSFFLPYQSAWIKDQSQFKMMEKARQIGLSWTTGYGLTRSMAHKDARTDAWISSRDDLQARLFKEDCNAWAKVLHMAAEDMGLQIIDEEKKISAYVLAFANGTRIHSMSSNPDAQAGKRGARVLDEFALHPDPRKLYSIASPGITWGGTMQIISTHRGSHNFFNELVQEIKHKGNPKRISLHTVTLQNALDQGFLRKLKGKLPPHDPRQQMSEAQYFDYIRAQCADEESFLQEFMCVPADDAGAFLTYDQIAACEYPLDEKWEKPLGVLSLQGAPLYVGMDVGRKHDLTVIWVLQKVAGMYLTVLKVEMLKQTFAAQEAVLYEILACPAVKRACLDATGIGMQLAENAKKRFGYKVEEINFTGEVKESLAYPLRAAFEDKNIRIPNDKFIRADLRSIKKETTAAGNIRFTADTGPNGHADRFWALALALHAGKQTNTPGMFRPFLGGRYSRALSTRRERVVVG